MIVESDPGKPDIARQPSRIHRIIGIGNPVLTIQKIQHPAGSRNGFIRNSIQGANRPHRLHQQDQRGDKGNHIANRQIARRYPPSGKRNHTADSHPANHFQNRVNSGAAGQQADKPGIEPVKCNARAACLTLLELIGLDHARALQRFSKQRGDIFHMFLQLP